MSVLEQIEYDVVDKKTGELRRGCIRKNGLYPPRDAADAIRKTVPHIYNLMNRHELPFVQLGGNGPRRIPGEAILKYATGK